MPAVDQVPPTPKRLHWRTTLKRLGACSDARTWAKGQTDIAAAWATCDRGDWLLWIAARVITDPAERMLVVLAACDCAETALVHVPAGEDRPRKCIDTVRAWTRGEATIEQVREGRSAAYAADAAYAAAADAAYAAAYAAADAAADAAAYAAAYAYAADADAAAAADADVADADVAYAAAAWDGLLWLCQAIDAAEAA